jgi:GT2 family glycosyltransferase
MNDYTITFATLNGLQYTEKCIESLLAAGINSKKIVVVDNGSEDKTKEYLLNLNLGNVILNKQNLSCGTAWNQGILSKQSEWTIVMNNDLLVQDNFAERLIEYAVKNNLKLVSPARIDGLLNYDFTSFSKEAAERNKHSVRMNSSNAICMCIHWSLFNDVGFFRADPKLLGFEDGLFYNEIRNKKIAHATTGSVWIHHFGGITQNILKKKLKLEINDVLLKVNDRKLYGQSWLDRKIYRYNLKKQNQKWRDEELLLYGMTLHGLRNNDEFIWV